MKTVTTIITDYLEIQTSEDHSVAHAQQSATRKKNAKQCHLMKETLNIISKGIPNQGNIEGKKKCREAETTF